MDFEKKLQSLEKIVAKMESGESSLEESLKDFEEGVRITKECHKQLDEAEQKVKLLLSVSEDGVEETSDFSGLTQA